MQKATFAAGCFWGVEATFRQVEGVRATSVGYTGGAVDSPSYEQVCTGTTGHAEAVEVEFDPAVVAYQELLDVFWGCHDPTTRDRQGPDVGSQYRSAVFFDDAQQEATARASKEALTETEKYRSEIVTEITAAGPYYLAEDYHQQYLEKQGLGSCGN